MTRAPTFPNLVPLAELQAMRNLILWEVGFAGRGFASAEADLEIIEREIALRPCYPILNVTGDHHV